MAAERPRVILDCNALLQAFLSPDGPAAACLALAEFRQRHQNRLRILSPTQFIDEPKPVV